MKKLDKSLNYLNFKNYLDYRERRKEFYTSLNVWGANSKVVDFLDTTLSSVMRYGSILGNIDGIRRIIDGQYPEGSIEIIVACLAGAREYFGNKLYKSLLDLTIDLKKLEKHFKF